MRGTAIFVALIASACATTASPGNAPHATDAETQTQELVVAALDEIALGRGDYHEQLATPFIIGPALWGKMVKADPTLIDIGSESVLISPGSDPKAARKMRTFFGDESVSAIARHRQFRSVADGFRHGTARPATPRERSVFYAVTPLETEGKPLTVITVPAGHRLVVYVEERRLMWMDLLSEYSPTL